MSNQDNSRQYGLFELAADWAAESEVGHAHDEWYRKAGWLMGQVFDSVEHDYASIMQAVCIALDYAGLKTEADILLQMIDMEPEEIEERWDYGDPSPRGCGSAEED
jgi:hypothetical protein